MKQLVPATAGTWAAITAWGGKLLHAWESDRSSALHDMGARQVDIVFGAIEEPNGFRWYYTVASHEGGRQVTKDHWHPVYPGVEEALRTARYQADLEASRYGADCLVTLRPDPEAQKLLGEYGPFHAFTPARERGPVAA